MDFQKRTLTEIRKQIQKAILRLMVIMMETHSDFQKEILIKTQREILTHLAITTDSQMEIPKLMDLRMVTLKMILMETQR